MAALTQTVTRPTSKRDYNGHARVTPKTDRAAVKADWATWVEEKRQFNLTLGPDPGDFAYTGLAYV